jgi:hypothetical protein
MKKAALIFILVSALALFFYKFAGPKSVWNGKSRLSLVVAKPDGAASVIILDPTVHSRTIINIPANTQLEVANQLGVWKLSSVWKLGQQEGPGGSLLSDSVMKSFKFPLDAWVSPDGQALLSSNPLSVLKSIFVPRVSSLSFSDRLRLAWYSFNLKSTANLPLEKTGYIEKARLASGEDGYVIKKNMPIELEHLFFVKEIADEGARVNVKNATGNGEQTSEVSSIINILGAKVVSLQKEEPRDVDCQLLVKSASRTQTPRFLSRIFRCDLLTNQDIGNFDLELVLGTKFAKRF